MSEIPQRLTPKTETIKLLLLRSGNQCAFLGCNHSVFNDNNELIAECCHIEAALLGGERFNMNQSNEDRRSYENLVFLCHKHHVETSNVDFYSVDNLRKIKTEHENRFKDAPFYIHQDYIQIVLSTFNEIKEAVLQTAEVVKRIEVNQGKLYDILNLSPVKSKKENTHKEYLPPTTIQFQGRTNELIDLERELPNYNTFQIGGISGIGKSTFTASFIHNHFSSNCIWIDCRVVKTKELFFSIIADYFVIENNDNLIKQEVLTASDSAIIKCICSSFNKSGGCIVLDSLNSDQEMLFDAIGELNKYAKCFKVFFTTNIDLNTSLWNNPVYKKTLSGLDCQSSTTVLKVNGIPNITDVQGNKLFSLLNGHPFLLKIISGLSAFQQIDEIILDLSQKRDTEVADYLKRRILDYVDNTEWELLIRLAYVQVPFRYKIVSFLIPETFKEDFKKLQKKYIVQYKRNDFYELPEFLRSEILLKQSNTNELELHKKIFLYFNSIKEGKYIFESQAELFHAVKGGVQEAQDIGTKFLFSLLARGMLNFVYTIALDLEKDSKTNKWEFVYYTLGRVDRFHERWLNALKNYRIGLSLCKDALSETFEFEIASTLIYISENNENTNEYKEAISLYNKLALSLNSNISLQAKAALGSILLRMGKTDACIKELENAVALVNQLTDKKNTVAGIWQLLGEAYSKKELHQKAIDCFEKSVIEYEEVLKSSGMNAIDGLYHLYDSLAWTYVKAKEYLEATRIFHLAVDLSNRYGLVRKFEKSLFDYGYHLNLIGQHDLACEVLSDYYDLINDFNIKDDTDLMLVYGTLCFSHWYCSQYKKAVELMALYINQCAHENKKPVVSVIQEKDTDERIDTLDFFTKRIYVLIIPEKYSFNDFNEWLKLVANERPELTDILNSFHFFKKECE